MAASLSDTARPVALPWAVGAMGLLLLVLGLLNIGAEIKFSFAGHRESATITTTAGGIGRSRSVDASASVAPGSGAPLVIDLHDTLNSAHWKEGDRVEILCAHIHADHLTCIADLWFDRYAVPLIMTIVGALLVLGAWKMCRRSRASTATVG